MNKNFKKSVIVGGLIFSLLLIPTTASAAKYKVTESDSLFKLGQLFKTPVSKIKSMNKLKSNEIRPGQVLQFDARSYTIKKGDTLKKIADKYGITLGKLRKANSKWNNRILVGQKLVLPGIKPEKAAKKTAKKSTKKSTAKKTTTAKVSSSSNKAVIPYTKAELDLLARLITAEATGQPYEAMVAIGGVVVNRVQSKEWPNSIDKVVNHVSAGYYQFTPVKNGYINNPTSDIALKAAKESLTGKDPSKGAMFYFDDSATNEWLWAKPILVRYGKMVFVK